MTGGNKETEQLLLEFIGVILSNVKGWRMKKALFLVGDGNTGKSQLKSLTERLLGSENYIGIDLKEIEARFGTGAVYSTRLAGSSDMSFLTVDELKTFKKMTGGDALYAELASRKDVVAAVAPTEGEEAKDRDNSGVLALSSIQVGQKAADKWEAISAAGALLVKGGYVKMDYVDAMMEREKVATTYLGMGIAIPHGTQNAKRDVLRTGISVVQYPEGVEFDGEKAYLVIGIAGVGDEHLELLARVSEALDDEQVLEKLKSTVDPSDIYEVLNA